MVVPVGNSAQYEHSQRRQESDAGNRYGEGLGTQSKRAATGSKVGPAQAQTQASNSSKERIISAENSECVSTPYCTRDDASSSSILFVNKEAAAPPSSSLPTHAERDMPGNEKEGLEPSKDCFFLSFGNNKGMRNDLVKLFSEKTSQWMEGLEEKRRKETAEHRISQALIGLKAANERSLSLEAAGQDGTKGSSMREPVERSSLREMVGDVGVAMFSPLDDVAFESLRSSEAEDKSSVSATSEEDDESESEAEEYPVEVEPESQLVLSFCPRLLTEKMMQQLVDEALPEIVKTMYWKRIFAIGRDGDAFCTMLQCCASYKHTIVVVQTTEGHIFGGYATEPWQRQEGHNMGRSFFGSGQSFLFSTHCDVRREGCDGVCDGIDNDMEDHTDQLTVFKWTGDNRYCQVCDVDNGQMAMGGGGAFGLIVEENFSRGGTGACDTFANPPLIPNHDHRFDISNFEVYGFESAAAQPLSPPNSPVF